MRKLVALALCSVLLGGLLCWGQVTVIACGGPPGGALDITTTALGANYNNSGTNATVTFSATGGDGHTTIVAVISTYTGSGQTVTDSASQTYSCGTATATPASGYVRICYKTNSASITSVSAHGTGSTAAIAVTRLVSSGTGATYPTLDAAATGASGGTANPWTLTTGNVTTAANNEVLISGASQDSYVDWTAWNMYGSTMLSQTLTGSSGQPAMAMYKHVATSGTVANAEVGTTGAGPGVALVATAFKP